MRISPHTVRRAWPLVTVGLLSLAAYFQASGVSALVGASLAPSAVVTKPRPSGDESGIVHAAPGSAEPILARNPFDSVTGPLIETSRGEATAAKTQRVADPLDVPKCEGIRVDATTESSDPLWSIAVVQGPSDVRGRVRRVGQKIGAQTVAYIGVNPRLKSPAVWLESETGLCQALLFDREKPGAKKPPPKKKTVFKPQPRKRGPPNVPKQIADKIKRISATEYQIDRSVVDVVVRDYSKLMRGVAVKPVLEGGKVAGLRISRSTPGSLLNELGLMNGDVLRSINGYPLASPEKALQAYARLRTADEIRIEVSRKNKPTTIELHIN